MMVLPKPLNDLPECKVVPGMYINHSMGGAMTGLVTKEKNKTNNNKNSCLGVKQLIIVFTGGVRGACGWCM